MAVLKNYPIRLNRDDDVRRLQPTDMTYALNVQTSKSSGRDEGVLENVKGTTAITNSNLPAGTNKCIGVITHEQSNNLFYFIWNSNGNHAIYYVNDITGNVRQVLQSSVLNFNKNGYIVGEAYQGRSSEEILLYFTDNINPPRKVNVQKALNNKYSTIDEEVISLIKYAPSSEPTWNYTADNSVVYNNVYNKNYQFRCRYLYDDGEYSAYSAASSLSYNDKQLLASLKDSVDPYSDLNNIEVTVPTGSQLVEKIEVICRRGDDAEWRVIKTLRNNTINDTITFDFKDDGSYPVADPIETNKYFDNVPLQAEAIAMLNSRLFLGNYIDGFDPNPDIQALNTGDNVIILNARSENFDIPVFESVVTSVSGKTASGFAINVFFNTLTPNVGDIFILNVYASFPVFEASVSGGFIKRVVTPTIFESYVVQNGDTLSDVLNNLVQGVSLKEENLFERTATVVNDEYISIYITNSVPTSTLVSASSSATINTAGDSGKYPPLSAGQSFKKGSKYALGIVEYDEAGRASTVNTFPNNEVYIPFYSERATNTADMLGLMSIDYRLGENIKPSLRAKKWSWCITENTSIGEFVQYSASGAYTVANPDYPSDDTVYVSIRGLQSQNSSYVTAYDAVPITYNYQDGDRLRVISYIDEDGNRTIASGNLDFRITSGRIYGEEDSPIYNGSGTPSDIQSRTGYILGLEPITEDGWSSDSSSFWNKSTNGTPANQGAVIFEIYRPKKQTEDTDLVYYEVGGVQDVVDAGLSTRKFSGGLRQQGESSSYAVSSQTISSVTIAQESINFVIGDVVSCKNGIGTQIATGVVTDIQPSAGSTIVYLTFDTDSVATISTVELIDKPAAGNITQGDVWVKPRLIRNDNFVNAQTYIFFPVEDYNLSDFTPSASWGKGRPNAFSEDAKEVRRFSTVTYSETYFNETNVNGLSSFNLGLANFQQYNQSYGAIRRLYSNDVYLVCFQENKIGRIPIERRVISTADGADSLTLSQNILNEIDYYKGDYGLTKAESFVAFDGDFFGWDIKKAKVWELSAAGLQLVSDYKFSSYIEEQSKELLPYYKNARVLLGLDREFDTVYISSLSSVSKQAISDSINSTDEDFPEVEDDGTNLVFKAQQQKTSSQTSVNKVSEETRTASEITVPLSTLGNTEQNLNLLPEVGEFEYAGGIQTSGTQAATFKINLGGTERYALGTFDFSTNEIKIPKTQSGFTLALAGGEVTYTGFTAGYNKNYNIWTSFYSFLPEMYGNINYSCYSFKNGVLYKHNTSSTYNNFYGSQYNTVFEVNFNQEPSRVKIFDATSIEGNKGNFSVTLDTNLASSSIPSTYFSEKEGFFQAMIPRSTNSSSNFSDILGGGTGSFTGSNLTITGMNVYEMGVKVNDVVYDNAGSSVGTITAIVDADTVTVSAGSGSGFFYIGRPSAIIEGDRMRGYYLTARYTNTDTDFTEVFAVNSEVTNSRLHNT